MGDITLRKALDDYKTIYMPYRNFAQRTREEYLSDLNGFCGFAEKSRAIHTRELGLPLVERFVADLEYKGLASLTRKRKVVAIRSFLSYLYQDQYISADLAKQLISPFTEPKSPHYLTKSEYETLLEAASGIPRDFAMIQLLLQTGIKLSELTRLGMADIELPSRILPESHNVGYLRLKGSESQKGRTLPLNHKACLALNKYLKQRLLRTNPALFVNRFGQPLGPRGVEKIIKKYIRQTGISDANVQSLRHTFGVYHASKGASIEAIRWAMGYKDLRSAIIFVGLSREMMKEMQNNTL